MLIGSMCTGFGGLDEAVKMLYPDASVTWCSEINKSANRLIEKRFGYKNLGDLTTIDWDNVTKPDLITAGYPCQSFSVAGKRKGQDDERGTIWRTIRNSLIPLGRPDLYLENVRGHVSLGFETVLGDLAALGYSARWCCLSASSVGAPHKRERLFVYAYADSSRPRKQQDTRRIRNLDIDTNHKTTRKELKHRSATNWGKYEPAIRRWETVLGRPAPRPAKNNRLNPYFVEWMMGVDESLICGEDLELTINQQLTLLGNGVVKQQAAAAYLDLIA